MGSKSSKQLDTSVPTGKPSRVMNEDIVINILSNLSVKQLIQLQIASKQVLICVPMALKQKKMLTIGKEWIKDMDITKAIVRLEVIESESYRRKTVNYWYDLTTSLSVLQSFADMCPRIQSLDLMYAIVDYPSISLMINECPKLTSLAMIQTKFQGLDAASVPEWTQLLAPRLTRWTVRQISPKACQQLMNILSELTSLREYCGYIGDHSNDGVDLPIILNHIPAGVRRLKVLIALSSVEKVAAIAPFITRCGQHLEALDFITVSAIEDSADQLFSAVCNGCPNLKRLVIDSNYLHSNILTENISKLKLLKHLELSYLEEDIEFNAIKPMPSLKTVSVNDCPIRSTQWTRVAIIWPNVWRLSISLRSVRCECGGDHRICHQSINQYLQCLSYMPRVTRLDLLNSLDVIDDHLNPFIELKTLCLKGYLILEGLPQLISFIEYCEANRVTKKPLKLVVSQTFANQLVNRFQEMGVNEWQSIRLHLY